MKTKRAWLVAIPLFAVLLAATILVPMMVLAEDSPTDLELAISLTRSTVNVDRGESVTAALTATGGTGPYLYSYDWYSYENDVWQIPRWGANMSANTDTFTPVFGEAGYIEAKVIDSAGNEATAEMEFDIAGSPDTEPFTINLSLDKTAVDIGKGESINGTWIVEGGKAPYSLYFDWWLEESGVENRVLFGQNVELTSSSLKPQYGKTGRLEVYANDSDGRYTEASISFTLSGSELMSPISLSVHLDKDSVDASEEGVITATWDCNGGSGEYTYDVFWYVHEKNYINGEVIEHFVKRLRGTTAISDSLMVTFGTQGYISVRAIDTKGRVIEQEQWFIIEGNTTQAPPLEAFINLSPVEPQAGEKATITIDITGGLPPYQCAYDWYILASNYYAIPEKFSTQPASKAIQNTVTVPVAEGLLVNVTVSDAEGRSVQYQGDYIIRLAENNTLPGDANADGKIDILDPVAIIDHIVSGTALKSPENANANGEGDIDILDLVWVIDRIVGG